jgi:four helix bundle protein
MATVHRFEDLEIWQLAMDLCRRLYEITKEGDLSKDYRFKDQIRAASGSIMDNIAEGFERNGKGEFIQHLSIAKGSAGEVRSQLYRAFDQQYFDKDQFDKLYNLAGEIASKKSNLISYLNASDIRGSKFKNRK